MRYTRGRNGTRGYGLNMTYKEYIEFIIHSEDKNTENAIEYWYRAIDGDGDGVVSLYELEEIYENVYQEMGVYGEWYKWKDYICVMYVVIADWINFRFDYVRPKSDKVLTLQDFKKCVNPGLIFEFIFDPLKYEHNTRRIDPCLKDLEEVWVESNDGERYKLRGWQKYAEKCYDELAMEESGNESEMCID